MARRQTTKTAISGDVFSVSTETNIEDRKVVEASKVNSREAEEVVTSIRENQDGGHEESEVKQCEHESPDSAQHLEGHSDSLLMAKKDNSDPVVNSTENLTSPGSPDKQASEIENGSKSTNPSPPKAATYNPSTTSGTNDKENGNRPLNSKELSFGTVSSTSLVTNDSISASMTLKDVGISSKGTETPHSASVTPKGSGSTPTKDTKSPFFCSCGRNFDTRRGLSIHLAHEPGHTQDITAKKSSELTSPISSPSKDQFQDTHSEPSSPGICSSSPLSAPSSPTFYSMTAFKTSSRNPQYYSIIRTRRASNANEVTNSIAGGSSSVEVGNKRPRSGTSGLSSGQGTAAKTLLLNNGDKVSIAQGEEISDTGSLSSSVESGSKRRSRESGESKGGKIATPNSRLRVRSLSGGSDNASSPTTSVGRSGSNNSYTQEFNIRSSPVTRSNAASMKAHEFISLPRNRRKRGKRGGLREGGRGGGGRGGGSSKQHNISSEDNASEIGEDFDSPTSMKTTAKEDSSPKDFQMLDIPDDPPPLHPPKRKRGRPPKVRRDTPSTSPASSSGVGGGANLSHSKSSPSLSSGCSSSPGPISSSTRSRKSHGRGGKTNIHSTSNIKVEPAEENPLPSKSDNLSNKISPGDSSKLSLSDTVDSDKMDTTTSSGKTPGTPQPTAIPNILPQAYGKNTECVDSMAPPPSTSPSAPPTLSDSRAPKNEKSSSTSSRGRLKRTAPDTNSDGEFSARKRSKKNSNSKTPTTQEEGNISKVKTQSSDNKDLDEDTAANSDFISKKSSKTESSSSAPLPPPTTPPTTKKESRSKIKTKDLSKSKTPTKSSKGGSSKKKSGSDSDGTESDCDGVIQSNKSEAAVVVVAEAGGEGENGSVEDAALPTAQITVSQQRQSSVFVSVLSGPEKKGEASNQSEDLQLPNNVDPSSSGKEGKPAGKEPVLQKSESQRRLSETPTSPVFAYPTSSTPTPTYPQFPFPGSFPPPHPHHMMYPSGPGSPLYPPHFYGYPGTQPIQMPLPHGAYLSGPPHPSLSMTHSLPPNTSGDQPSTHTMYPHVSFSSQAFPPNSLHGAPSGSPNSTTAAMVTSVATTVGGVRVSVLDKPPTQLPMVTLPYHMPSATAPRTRPPAGYPMDLPPPPGMRAYIGSGGHSPDGLHPPHPLSQVYRPGMMGPPYTPSHLPPPHPYTSLTVRLDPTGMPYMEWPGHEPRPPPSEEHPVQPVECPECGRMFKNNKALNGHMRLHGGFDWTKKQPFTNTDQSKQQSNNGSSSTCTSSSNDHDTKNLENTSSKVKSTTTKSVGNRKHSKSKSRSRSRSKSPVPNVSTKSKGKHRKSSDETAPSSNLLKEAKKAEEMPPTSLPIPRAPSIFTFDPNSAHATQHKPHPHPVRTASSSSTTPSSEGQEESTLTHSGSTLDDLCRAAAELERMDTNAKKKEDMLRENCNVMDQYQEDDLGKKRPGNITIPQTQSPSTAIERERHRLGATPPYTPPPILSPSRSFIHLAPGMSQVNASAPCTPNRILQHWSSRRSADGRRISDNDDVSFSEPRINIGPEFQAKLPNFDESRNGVSKEDPRSTLLWKPIENLTEEDESVIDGFLELACSPAVLHGGRNKEIAIHFLQSLGGSIKEAVRWLLSGKTLFDANSPMAGYNYSGSIRWSGRERQQFRRAWKVHRKQFNMLRSTVESKKFSEIIEYYYTWKKYCSDEYRGRNRHISEEIFSDEDDITYPQVPSSSSSGSGDSEPGNSSSAQDIEPAKYQKSRKNEKPSVSESPSLGSQPARVSHIMPCYSQNRMFNSSLPIVYAPHSSPAQLNQYVHQFPCKYPGCNQVFTSIFALNGHIRIHGGSFFPKPPSSTSSSLQNTNIGSSHSHTSLATSSSSRLLHSSSASQFSSSLKQHHHHHHHHHTSTKSLAELELAKALLELPGSSSLSKGIGYHTPSPKPSPGKSRALSGPKKKLSSSSPGEREGYYPCNRCGRVFTKVKSRSAHMKSHVIKSS